MTDQSFHVRFRVLNKRHRAAQALDRLSAVTAHDEGRHAAPVEIKDGLLLVLKRLVHDLQQAARERLPVACAQLVTHVDQLHRGVCASHPRGHSRQRELARNRSVVDNDAWRGGARDQAGTGDRCQAPRHPPGLVSGRAVLLVS